MRLIVWDRGPHASPVNGAAGRNSDLLGCNGVHATMLAKTTDRLMARPTGKLARRLNNGGNRIEWRPMPGTGGAKDSNRRFDQRGCDVQEPGVVRHHGSCGCKRKHRIAQVGSGEVADMGRVRPQYLGGELFFVR